MLLAPNPKGDYKTDHPQLPSAGIRSAQCCSTHLWTLCLKVPAASPRCAVLRADERALLCGGRIRISGAGHTVAGGCPPEVTGSCPHTGWDQLRFRSSRRRDATLVAWAESGGSVLAGVMGHMQSNFKRNFCTRTVVKLTI